MPESDLTSSLQLVFFNGYVVPISSVQDEDERAELLDR